MEDGADDAVPEEEDLGGVAEVVGGAFEEQDGRVEVLEVGRRLDLQGSLVLLLAACLVWKSNIQSRIAPRFLPLSTTISSHLMKRIQPRTTFATE